MITTDKVQPYRAEVWVAAAEVSVRNGVDFV